MAKKKRRKAAQSRPSQVPRVKELLQLAAQQMQRGRNDWAAGTAERALGVAKSAAETADVRRMLAEIYLNLAAEAKTDQEKLDYWDKALGVGADGADLRVQRGLALWRTGRLAEALAELEGAASLPAADAGKGKTGKGTPLPDLAFLLQLARCANGKAWQGDALSPAEVNTLHLIEALAGKATKRQLQSLLAVPLIGDPAIWQMLVAIKHEPAAVDLAALAALPDTVSKDSPNAAAILSYLHGVVAMKQENPSQARLSWTNAQSAGWTSPTALQNMNYLLRESLSDLAGAGEWEKIVDQARLHPAEDDAIWCETVGLAYFHLGWQAAQADDWATAALHWRRGNAIWGNRHLAQNLALAEESLDNWLEAAGAWREMIRRRPRKESHPDYLSDAQVAALWEHAAGCYEHTDHTVEVVTCLQNAVKYAPENAELRLRLVDAYMEEGRQEAAENELDRILAFDETNVAALTLLGSLYHEDWYRDAAPIWRRILAIDPGNVDARQGLAADYLQKAETLNYRRSYQSTISLLERGLAELPNSAELLLHLALTHRDAGHEEEAHRYFLDAYRAAPASPKIAGIVAHELLHLNAEADVEALLPEMRKIPGLLPVFWVEQGKQVLVCELGETWATRFFDEAIDGVATAPGGDTKAGVLIDIYEAVSEEEEDELVARYRKHIEAEAAESGAVEYIAAYDRHFGHGDAKGARRLMGKAKRQAKRAGDAGVLRRAEAIDALMSGTLPNLFGRGMPDPREIERILSQMFGEDEDEFPSFF